MNARIKPMNTLNTQVNQMLIECVGVVDTIRFINQFHISQSDYVKEKYADWLTYVK